MFQLSLFGDTPSGENMKRILSITALALCSLQAFGSVYLLTSRPATPTDDLDWGQAGADLASVASGTVMTTVGTPFNVSVTSDASMGRWDEGGAFNGNFAPGDKLISTYDFNAGSVGTYIEVTGAKTCSDVGAQIMSDYYGSFIAHIEAYDGLGNLIGAFDEAGLSYGANDGVHTADNTAIFIGVHSDAGDIHHVRFSTTNDGLGFMMNHVSYTCCGPVPEPASMSVLALGALGLLRKKRQA